MRLKTGILGMLVATLLASAIAGVGDEGETDARGPWNEGGKWKIVESPELEQGVEARHGKTVAKEHKQVSEDTGKTRVKKSA